jgi:hypothetical protein
VRLTQNCSEDLTVGVDFTVRIFVANQNRAPCRVSVVFRGILPGKRCELSGNKIYLFFVDAYERRFIRFAPTQIVPGASDHFLTNRNTLYEKKAFF